MKKLIVTIWLVLVSALLTYGQGAKQSTYSQIISAQGNYYIQVIVTNYNGLGYNTNFIIQLTNLLTGLGVTSSNNTVVTTFNVASNFTASTSLITNWMAAIIHTWPGPSNSFDFTGFRWQFTATGNMAITNFLGPLPLGNGYDVPSMLSVTNPWATNVTLYVTASGVTTDDSGRAYVVTNASQRKFSFNYDDQGKHLVSRPFQ